MNAWTRTGLVAAVLAAALLLSTHRITAEEGTEPDAIDWNARAQQTWHKTCARCHSVPDTRFETDRAFLGQITETS